jgi:hypothetical protein
VMSSRPVHLLPALLRREGGRACIDDAVVFAAAGIAMGWIANGLTGTSSLSTIITRFDHTVLAIAAVVATVRCVERLRADATADWLLQLLAAGASRREYVLFLPIAVAGGAFAAGTAGSLAFAATRAVMTGATAILAEVVRQIPLTAGMILSAAAFGVAVSSVWRARGAAYAAIGLLLAPWFGIALTLSTTDRAHPMNRVVEALAYPPPRLFVAYTLPHISYVVVYTAIMLGIGMTLADWRIGRVA